MRPRNFARPAAAGAICFAITGAGAQSAPAQTETTTTTTEPQQAGQAPQIGVHKRKLDVRAGNRTVVAGRVRPVVAGVRVSLQVRRDGRWRSIARDRTDAAGRFKLRERVGRTGSTHVRVHVGVAPGMRSGKRALGRLNVYRTAYASWYGPGLYGNRLGCGGTLQAGRLGVAHKSLPCGTMVTLKRGRHSLRVPVIDRGPYVGGREYDLTAATAQRLGFSGHGAVLVTR
jgi:rare lipoprotein A (peptidoglycan hydrolase)